MVNPLNHRMFSIDWWFRNQPQVNIAMLWRRQVFDVFAEEQRRGKSPGRRRDPAG